MRVLHIAAHNGNFGDRLSHRSLHSMLQEKYKQFDLVKKDIRDFYLNGPENGFFTAYIDRNVEQFDLIVVGGGGFLSKRSEYEGNRSLSMIEISQSAVERYGDRIVLASLGFEGKESNNSKQIDYLNFLSSNGARIFLRKDGGDIERSALDDKIFVGPDFALLQNLGGNKQEGSDAVGLVLSSCTLGVSEKNAESVLNCELKKVLAESFKTGREVKFFCHTTYDYSMLIELIGDIHTGRERELITIVPASNKSISVDEVINEYQACSTIFSMRFHGAVAGLLTGSSVFGYFGTAKIRALEEYGVKIVSDAEVSSVTEEGFKAQLPKEILDNYREEVIRRL